MQVEVLYRIWFDPISRWWNLCDYRAWPRFYKRPTLREIIALLPEEHRT